MALTRCILSMFLGVVCHCFPLPLDVPTFAARWLHVPINASPPSSERWNCGREWTGNFAEMTPFYAIYGSSTCQKSATWGKRIYFPSEGRHAEDVFARKIRRFRQGANPRSWVPEASMLTTRPPKMNVSLKMWSCFTNTFMSEVRTLPYISCVHKFSTTLRATWNCRRQKGDMKQVSRWRLANIWRHCTKFSCPGDQPPGTCAPVMFVVLTVGNLETLHKCCRRMSKSEVNICLWRKRHKPRMNVKSCLIYTTSEVLMAVTMVGPYTYVSTSTTGCV
jgi:hypothetical protein